ncbi:hypothetical protein Bhyg_13173 [Pseudolycoriella hygida]|uniref:Uncharacterized protein n=1 Tax=Pseudolycoriella hygida TaxID=35572 RepID=A0A9Q0RW63_9DIPT|nr:hypothetical protein Bhyg_13173 [Pseudolycoriella hygida]
MANPLKVSSPKSQCSSRFLRKFLLLIFVKRRISLDMKAWLSGSRNIIFNLSDDGMKLSINYVWPSALTSPNKLFSQQVADRTLILTHPKIHALTSRLLECQRTSRSLPQANIVVDLPMKVLREIGTWTKSGVKVDETRIALLEFQAYQKNQVINDTDTSITF